MDRVPGGDEPKVQTHITVSPVTGGYRLASSINGTHVDVLVDTGAAVTLLREDIWRQLMAQPSDLKPWPGAALVSAGGAPLTVHGCVCVDLVLGGKKFETEMVVVSPLTSEAILGIDFLQRQQATIDLGRKRIQLKESGCDIPLDAHTPMQLCTNTHQVHVSATVEVPPRCIMEVSAYFDAEVEGVWMVEEVVTKCPEVAVARAVVQPTSTNIPVRVMNVSDTPATLYAGAVIAVMQHVELPAAIDLVEKSPMSDIDDTKRKALWDLVQECSAELNSGEREVFYNLLLSHADVMASSTADLGRTGRLRHHINTGSSPPIRQNLRRVSPRLREEVQELLKQMLERGVIEPSSSPWASPVVLVQKKDGSTRFCIDYRKLNQVTRKDAYPLPRIDMTLDMLHGSRWFTTLDLLSGYWQVEVAEEDKEKTAFCTTEGLFQFRVLPFGLCNGPASFQRLMDLVLSGLQWSQCLVYLDDIIVLGRSFEEHIRNLDCVFQRLRESGLRLKPSKCVFFQEEVKYLGHIISREGVATDPDKTVKVATWPVPTSKRETQQFLGFANYYRRFIRDFALIARPLHRLTEKTASFAWTDACQSSFDQLRQCLTSAPVLAYPDFQRPFILDTDASDIGIGGVLSQLDDHGKERVIAYGSRLLTKQERQYCVTRRELLAVVTFVQQYRPYLVCRKFTLRTDHSSLTWLRNFKEPEGQLARWLERLQDLNFDVVHRQGTAHRNADALSRLPCRQCGRSTADASTDASTGAEVAATMLQLPPPQTEETLRQAQLADPVLAPLLQGKEAGIKPDVSSFTTANKAARRLLQLWNQLEVHGGTLCRRLSGSPEILQVVIPSTLREEVLTDLHEGAGGGHLGTDKTFGRVRERFYWPGYYEDVREWCRSCGTCAQRKSPTTKPRAQLEPIVTSYPLQLVAVDILGPLPESPAGNSYVLVVADYFTRYTEAYAIPNQEATTVANKLVDEFFFRFSPPEQLHSDQGRNFESSIILEVCRLLGVRKSRTTPYHPQSDGLVERCNRTLLDMLATAVQDRPFEWDQHLRRLCYAYNTSVHPTTGFTPFALMFGRQTRMPVDIMLGTAHPPPCTVPQYVADLHSSLEQAYAYVRDNMGHKMEQQKSRYDSRSHGCPFEVGDLVWLHNPAVPRGKSRKLHRPWIGPYRIVTRVSDVVYRLQHIQHRNQKPVVHFDRLKPCAPDTRLPQQNRQRSPRVRTVPRRSIGGGLELVDDDWDQDLSPSNQQQQRRISVPATVVPPANDTESISPQPPVTLHSSPSTDNLATPPREASPLQRRYPQRDRAPPARLYSTVSH